MKTKKIGGKKIATIILAVVLSLLVLVGTGFWVMLAYIETHKTYARYYNPNKSYAVTRAIAHRGYSAKEFDNTEEAFEAAGEESFFAGIETDIRLTRDGVWVCSHDDDPFADKSVRISQSDYEKIRDLPLDLSKSNAKNTRNYTICTYERYLSVCRHSGKTALIEIKGERTKEELEEAVGMALDALGYAKTVFAGFSLSNIEKVQKIDPYVKTLVFSKNALVCYCHSRMGNHIGTSKSCLTEKTVRRAHELNEFVYVYTIEEEKEWKKYTEMNVDFVITNDCFS